MVMTGGASVSCRHRQTYGQTEVLTGLLEAVHQLPEFLLGVGRKCCIISKQHVPDDNLAYIWLGPDTGEVEEPTI